MKVARLFVLFVAFVAGGAAAMLIGGHGPKESALSPPPATKHATIDVSNYDIPTS
jgi:hypothetical protein